MGRCGARASPLPVTTALGCMWIMAFLFGVHKESMARKIIQYCIMKHVYQNVSKQACVKEV